jgi:hypothetical protein
MPTAPATYDIYGSANDHALGMAITGTLSPDLTGDLALAGTKNGKFYFSTGGNPFESFDDATYDGTVLYWDSTASEWVLVGYASGSPAANHFTADENVLTPDLAETWHAEGAATGTVTCTRTGPDDPVALDLDPTGSAAVAPAAFDVTQGIAAQYSLTTALTGTNNDLVFTSKIADGYNISVAIATPAVQFGVTVAVADKAITITPGTKGQIVVTGTLTSDGSTPVVFPALLYFGTHITEGATWTDTGGITGAYSVIGKSGSWTLRKTAGAAWTSTDAVASPELVTTWTPAGAADGTPTLTPGVSTSAQAKGTLQTSIAAPLITVAHAPANDGTGALAAMTATHLSIDLPSGYTI